eukprot:jgi/Ulvmu1/2202/UM013_0048.1
MDIADLALSCLPRVYLDFVKSTAASFVPFLATTVQLRKCQVQVLGKLGEGGSGDVYEASILKSVDNFSCADKRAALKKVVCSDAEQLRLAELECDLMRKRLHPNIVSLLDTHVHRVNNPQRRHILYMLMPLYTEGSLWDVVQRRGQNLSNAEILSIVAQVADALVALHAAGWVHRDVKPQNILLSHAAPAAARAPAAAATGAPAPVQSPRGSPAVRCALTDLGSCCSVDSLRVEGPGDAGRIAAAAEAACSPLYRSPELYEPPHRGAVDGRADVWALGCVLYFLIMCVNPFERACQQGASLVLAVQRARADWAGAPADLHPDLKELVHACLRPNYLERPTSAEVRQWVDSHAHVIASSSFD